MANIFSLMCRECDKGQALKQVRENYPDMKIVYEEESHIDSKLDLMYKMEFETNHDLKENKHG